MAEEHEPGKGRMLFTDLDASDKGRPAVALDYAAGFATAEPSEADDDFLLKPIPTIQDLASSLELDFEDDWGSATGEDAPVSPENSAGPSPAPSARRTGSGAAERISSPSPPMAADVSPSAAGGAPGRDAESSVSTRRSATARLPEPLPPASSAGKTAPPPPDAPAGAFARRPEAEARLFPGIPDDADEELDILSLLSPTAGEMDGAPGFFESAWRGGRLGLDAPRERPYGGIRRLDEWYFPPAEPEKPGEEDVVELLEKMGGWHQPPGRTGSADDTAAYPPAQENAGAGADADMNASAADAAPASPSEAAPSPPPPPSDTRRLDMFSDMDLDALWEEKLRQPPDPGDRGSTRAITRALDMFDNIDLDSIWDEKRRRAEAAATAAAPDRPPPDAGDAGSTLILGRGHLENASTVIMPQDSRLQNIEAPSPLADRRIKTPADSPSAKEKSPLSEPPPVIGGNALSFLDDMGSFLADDDDAVQAPFQKRSPGPQAPAAPGELDLSDLMSMVDGDAPDVDDSIRPPVIGDDDIVEINGGFATQSQDERRAAAGKNRRKVRKNAESADSAGSPLNGGDGAEEPDYLPAGESEGESSPADGGSGDLAEADDGEPVPFIDDSAIPSPEEEEEPESDPEGLDALLARENAMLAAQLAEEDEKAKVWHGAKILKKKEDGEGEGEEEENGEDAEGDGDEAGEGKDGSAAVNPLDVFSNMDDLDFEDGDGLDDEMKAMLDEDDPEAEAAEGASTPPGTAAMAETPPDGFMARILFYAKRALKRIIPQSLIDRLTAAIAWRENWWFYCDLLAAIITSASLAIIISYYIWYRK